MCQWPACCIAGQFDVLFVTSAQQVRHCEQVAGDMGLWTKWQQATNRCVIGSIGPTASETLHEYGLPPDLEPTHPKMGPLVKETLEAAPAILARKRQ